MKSSKLLDLLNSFSPDEIKDFSVFLDKQIEKKDTLTKKLFLVLEKYYPVFNERNIKKEKIYMKVFNKKIYNENRFSKLMAALTKMAESYIAHIQKQEDQVLEKMSILQYYFERNLDKHFIKTARLAEDIINKMPIGSKKNIVKYQFAELVISYELKTDNRNGNYQRVFDELTEFIEAEKLRWENLSLVNLYPLQSFKNASGDFFFIHRQLNKLLKHPDDKLFSEVLQYTEKNILNFSDEESREILKILIDYSIQKTNRGYSAYYLESLRVYKLFIQKDLILNEYGKIFSATYKNYITATLKLGKIHEAESFLETYKNYLLDEIKEESYNFNKAHIWFEKEKYNEVVDLLISNKFTDVFYNINQRRLLIKTYYELLKTDVSYFELLASSMNTFKKFIYTKDAIPDIYILANKNFYKITQKMMDVSEKNTSKISTLLTQLKNTEKIAEREWLEKKLILML